MLSSLLPVVVVIVIGGADVYPSRTLGGSGRSMARPRLGATGDNGDNTGGALGGVLSVRGPRRGRRCFEGISHKSRRTDNGLSDPGVIGVVGDS